MAATVQLSESNGVGPASTTDGITSVNYGSFDVANLVPASHPIIVGQRSFQKFCRVQLVNLGGSTQIANIQIYKSSGAFVTGEGISSSANGSFFGPGQAGNITESYHTPSNASYTFVSGDATGNAALNMATSAPGGCNCTIAGSVTTALLAPGYSDYWVSQMFTSGSTPSGAVNQKVFTFQYDES